MAALVRQAELTGRCTVVVDRTGVGGTVVDLMRSLEMKVPLHPITITGGSTVTPDLDGWSVLKRDLVSVLQVLLDSGRLRFAKDLALANTLVQEFQNFKVKITATGNDTYEAWREGDHDDLVLAAGLACWAGESTYLEVLGQPSIEEEIRAKVNSDDPNTRAMQARIAAVRLRAAEESVRFPSRRTSRHREPNPWVDFYER